MTERPDIASLTTPLSKDDDNLLRDVRLNEFRLQLVDTQQQGRDGKDEVQILLFDEKGVVLFDTVMGCSPLHAIDSDEALRSAIGWITLRPGDVEEDFFEDYTRRQMAFAEGPAEELSLFADEESREPFEGWERPLFKSYQDRAQQYAQENPAALDAPVEFEGLEGPEDSGIDF